jgi:hypothetical protein
MWLSYLKNMLLIKSKFRGKKLQLAIALKSLILFLIYGWIFREDLMQELR